SGGVPVSAELPVNTYTTNAQAVPAVAMDGAGNFAVAWQSDGQDGDGQGVFARQFSAAGVPLGGEIRVNTTSAGAQGFPAVGVDPAGNAVIAWAGAGAGDVDGIFA